MELPSTEQNIKIKKNAVFKVFTALLTIILVLSFLSFFSNINTIVEYDITWKISTGIVLIIFLSTMIASIITNKQKPKIKGGVIKRTFFMLIGVLALAMLTIFAVYSGVPTALHYIDNKNGKMEVTVISKNDRYSKRKCSPRLTIKEFTFFTTNHICPGEDAFKKIKVGSKINIIGNISKYGIEPKQVQWLTRQ